LTDTIPGSLLTENANYPVASPRVFVSFATRMLLGMGVFVVPPGGQVEFQLFHNGVPVPGFIIVYTSGEAGITKTLTPNPEAFAVGDTFAVRVLTSGFAFSDDPLAVHSFTAVATIGTT
jgi:hypothetical protein